jgi:hypothetical protein
MRLRILASAAASLSTALATAADPLPIPPAGNPPAPATVPNTRPIAPSFLPALQPQEKLPRTELPTTPPPRPSGKAPPAAPAPGPYSTMPPAPAMPAVDGCDGPGMPGKKMLCDDHLGPWNTVWVRGGYNYMWMKPAPSAPVLLTTGVPGPNNTVLIGGATTSYGGFNTGTLEVGAWLNERHTLGISLGGFITEQRSNVSTYTSDPLGNPHLSRPFFNPQVGGVLDGLIVSAPGLYSGSIAVEQGAHVDTFDFNVLYNVTNTKSFTANFLLGMRYFDLDEYLAAYQVTQGINGNVIPFFGPGNGPVSSVMITDRIRTRNQMWAPQLGGNFEYRFGPIFTDAGIKAALGPVHQVSEVDGRTDGSNGASGPGGFLAVGGRPNGNIGRTSTNYFGVLADANALVGVQVSEHFRIGFGYQFMYLNTVARPANQIVPTIDPRLVPVSASYGARIPSSTTLGGPGTPPGTPYDRSDFFIHGLRFLVEVQF